MKLKDVPTVSNTARRKRYWKINAFLYYLLKLNFMRDKNLWIFGAWEGNKYDDNTKYFFEYINKYHKEIRAIWISNNPEIINEVREKGFEAELSYSKAGKIIQLKAGKAFLTNGIDDFDNINYIYGAQIIGLWHAVPIKRTYYAQIEKGTKRYIKQRIKDIIFCWVHQDLSIATSKYCRELLSQMFHMSSKKIVVTGFPRNDVFIEKSLPSKVLKNMWAADEYKYVLYMPTYRPENNSTIFSAILKLTQSVRLIEYMKKNRIRLLIKLHYMTKIELTDMPDGFYFLEKDEISSTQELLNISELLITDYSSCITDFVITRKPSLLYAPDYRQYINEVGLYDEWIPIYEKYAEKDEDRLAHDIIYILQEPENCLGTTNAILNMCYDEKMMEISACRQLWDYLFKK